MKEMNTVFCEATDRQLDEILKIYEEVKGGIFCTWDRYYPAKENITEDHDAKDLFVLMNEEEIVGVISIVPQRELDDQPFWKKRTEAAEIARVCIRNKYQGKGYAKILVSSAIEELKRRGIRCIHLSVAKKNLPAQRTYLRLGFEKVGESMMYGGSYYLMESIL